MPTRRIAVLSEHGSTFTVYMINRKREFASISDRTDWIEHTIIPPTKNLCVIIEVYKNLLEVPVNH